MTPEVLMLPVVGVGIATYGIGTYVSRNRGMGSGTGSDALRPGWLARRRARGGIAHKPRQVGVGYQSARQAVRLDLETLALPGYVGGAPGSGKTTLLRQLIAGFPGPVIVLDAKGSMDLVDAMYGAAGNVWEVGGPLKLDVLDDNPATLAEQLLEGEIFTDRAAVYRAIAEHAVIRAATVLQWRAEPREPARILELISSPETLREAIRHSMPPLDSTARRWLTELDKPSRTMEEGFQTFGERLGTLLDSPAGASLGTGPESIRLQDVLASKGKLLIRLDPRYGMISRKVGAWTLVAMLRMAAELRRARWQGRCLFVVDEPRSLGHEGRHLMDLIQTARDAGIGVVIADQGVAGLSAVHPDMPQAVLRLTAWQVAFRQGSPADAEVMSALFGHRWRADQTRSSDGRVMTRQVEDARVPADWLMQLPTAHAWVRATPVGLTARERIASIVVAMPPSYRVPPRKMLPAPAGTPADEGVTPSIPDPTVDTLTERREALAKRNIQRLIGEADEQGCRKWRGSHKEDKYGDFRPVCYWDGKSDQPTHRVLAKWRDPELPSSWDVHHSCLHRWCVADGHLVAMPRGEHQRLHAAERRAAVDGSRVVIEQAELPIEGPTKAEQARSLKAAGRSLRQIAKELTVSHETVRKWVDGVKVDGGGDSGAA